ncbi:MAG: peptidoglycan DD-metalloendopeptidase family protein [Xanthomonadales bacterium]
MALLLVCFLTACRTGWSPEEKRATGRSSYQLTKDGHYRVRKGDSLHAIAFNYGLDWRDIAAWNHIRAPYLIYPDQELRLAPPRQYSSSAAKPGNQPAPARSTSQTVPPRAASSKTSSQSSATTTALKTPQASTKSSLPRSSITAPGSDPATWMWPTSGKIISNYKANDSSRKGIDISGKEGQAIIAAAPGEVVYSGSGLIAYGELIIIKHSDQFLSAYAHNRKRLVAEGQKVKAGTKIAEMGRNDRNQILLHFEIRVNGNPRDPLNYLPQR